MEAPLNSRTPRVVKVTDPLEENPLPSLFEALIDRCNELADEEQTKKPKQTRMPDSKMAAEPRKAPDAGEIGVPAADPLEGEEKEEESAEDQEPFEDNDEKEEDAGSDQTSLFNDML